MWLVSCHHFIMSYHSGSSLRSWILERWLRESESQGVMTKTTGNSQCLSPSPPYHLIISLYFMLHLPFPLPRVLNQRPHKTVEKLCSSSLYRPTCRACRSSHRPAESRVKSEECRTAELLTACLRYFERVKLKQVPFVRG